MKTIAILLLSLLAISVSQAQDLTINQKIKYVTHAPDGSVAFVILDDINKMTMKLDASEIFYKYEVLDTRTATPIYSKENKGSSCLIDKSLLGAGNYKLKLYSKNFIITSKITVLSFRMFNKFLKNESLALNTKD